MPEPALYLHRLEAGQLVRGVLGLELLIEPLQDVRGPAYDPRQDGRLVVVRRVQGLEPRRPDPSSMKTPSGTRVVWKWTFS